MDFIKGAITQINQTMTYDFTFLHIKRAKLKNFDRFQQMNHSKNVFICFEFRGVQTIAHEMVIPFQNKFVLRTILSSSHLRICKIHSTKPWNFGIFFFAF